MLNYTWIVFFYNWLPRDVRHMSSNCPHAAKHALKMSAIPAGLKPAGSKKYILWIQMQIHGLPRACGHGLLGLALLTRKNQKQRRPWPNEKTLPCVENAMVWWARIFWRMACWSMTCWLTSIFPHHMLFDCCNRLVPDLPTTKKIVSNDWLTATCACRSFDKHRALAFSNVTWHLEDACTSKWVRHYRQINFVTSKMEPENHNLCQWGAVDSVTKWLEIVVSAVLYRNMWGRLK